MGALSSALLVVGGSAAASANVTWCVSDPPVQVVTPAGHHLMVNNMVYLSVGDKDFASLVTGDASAEPDGRGGSLVTVHVYIPREAHGAMVVSENHRYRVADTKSTPVGGTALIFKLDVPTP